MVYTVGRGCDLHNGGEGGAQGTSGVVAGTSDFQSELGRWFKPGLCRYVAALDKKHYSTISLLTQVFRWVPALVGEGRLQYKSDGGACQITFIPKRYQNKT